MSFCRLTKGIIPKISRFFFLSVVLSLDEWDYPKNLQICSSVVLSLDEGITPKDCVSVSQ